MFSTVDCNQLAFLRTDEDLGCEELSPSSSFCEDPEKPPVLEDTSPLEEIRYRYWYWYTVYRAMKKAQLLKDLLTPLRCMRIRRHID
jgi:hypothetical protein